MYLAAFCQHAYTMIVRHGESGYSRNMENVMDWSACPDVERKPGVVSGAFVVRGTRVQADAILSNAEDGYSPEEISEDIFPTVPVEQARRIIAFARQHEPHPAG